VVFQVLYNRRPTNLTIFGACGRLYGVAIVNRAAGGDRALDASEKGVTDNVCLTVPKGSGEVRSNNGGHEDKSGNEECAHCVSQN
jgi:hypothetical protein